MSTWRFGIIAVTAGVAAPLAIVAAGVAVVLRASTVAESTRVEPPTGSFITYVETRSPGTGRRPGRPRANRVPGPDARPTGMARGLLALAGACRHL